MKDFGELIIALSVLIGITLLLIIIFSIGLNLVVYPNNLVEYKFIISLSGLVVILIVIGLIGAIISEMNE